MRIRLPVLALMTSLALLSIIHPASASYDPGVQRWINRDPLGDEASLRWHGHGKSVGRKAELFLASLESCYGFVGNVPTGAVDEHGLSFKLPIVIPKDANLEAAIRKYYDSCAKDGICDIGTCTTICLAFYGNVSDTKVWQCEDECESCDLEKYCKKNPPPRPKPPPKKKPPKTSPPPGRH